MLTPQNPQQAIRTNFHTLAEKIYSSLSLAGTDLTLRDARRLLTQSNKSELSKLVTNYYTTLDYIRYEWVNNPAPITNKTLFTLHKLITSNVKHTPGLREKKLTIKDGAADQPFTTPTPEEIPFQLDSLMSEVNQPERQHPAVSAGIGHVQILRIMPFNDHNQLTAQLFCELILAKHNLTHYYLPNLESIFAKNPDSYYKAAQETLTQQANLNNWLEFFTNALVTAQEQALARLTQATQAKPTQQLGTLRLNSRQQAILRLLAEPNSTINNTDVVKQFEVSQITASRDLAKLKSLKLVAQIGRGRSTTYTRL